MTLCIVCRERPIAGKHDLFCRHCARSYDRDLAAGDGTVAGAIIWAAKRARWFERRRARPRQGS